MAVTAGIAKRIAEKHNSELKEAPPGVGHNSSGETLKAYLARRVALEQEKMTLAEDIKELNAEAKEHGIEPRALAVHAKRQLEDDDKKAKRLKLQETVDSYAAALGFLD